MKTLLKLKQAIVIACIGICGSLPFTGYAQEKPKDIGYEKGDIRRSPSRCIITMSYDEQADAYQLHFNVAMENVDVMVYKDGELIESENFTTISAGYQERLIFLDNGEYTIIVTVRGETVFEDELIVES